ncbi:uncharacterized protein M421DRAFT_96118 [Didymella exigua CBS 183.55]|uniref:Uncharacterized protein n=1 Tax=Didymella exigua CBS 183.55 TaxID=1150837 RepID=A0A6A5R8B5_9PLEO|nr:uncharacterized protein M421DRAFT_96118 [Didymella exigua CBS 183.55]KAF1923460.1 hypothetical protein M421DRAFT_96118 [Didymella exigua CBS 183.55]
MEVRSTVFHSDATACKEFKNCHVVHLNVTHTNWSSASDQVTQIDTKAERSWEKRPTHLFTRRLYSRSSAEPVLTGQGNNGRFCFTMIFTGTKSPYHTLGFHIDRSRTQFPRGQGTLHTATSRVCTMLVTRSPKAADGPHGLPTVYVLQCAVIR